MDNKAAIARMVLAIAALVMTKEIVAFLIPWSTAILILAIRAILFEFVESI